MKKAELSAIHNILEQIYSDFRFAHYDYKNGKNAKIRKDAERKVDSCINLATYHIKKHPEIYTLLVGENTDGFGQAIILDEFVLPQWFGRDLSDLLQKINDKIKQAED